MGEASAAGLAGIYTRISLDEDLTRLGVQRQEEDCRRIAAYRNLQVRAVYEDDDLSGSGKVRRPRFEQLLSDMRAGLISTVIAYDIDRLMRGHAEYIAFYETAERRGLTVAWLGGEADFAAGTGLLELEIRAAFAREELRKIRNRVKRWHLQKAERGEDVGGNRPFGYTSDRRSIEAAEADLIREAAERVIAGSSLRSICVDWTERGIRGATGAKWTAYPLRRILTSARISGRRELRVLADGSRAALGRITNAEATWPAIISPQQSDLLRAILTDPNRSKVVSPREYLLTGGVARCGLCGAPLVGRPREDRTRRMVCAKGPSFTGCGRMFVVAEPVEAIVAEAVLRAVEDGALKPLVDRSDDSPIAEELRGVEERLKRLGEEWAGADAASTIALKAASQYLADRHRELTERLRVRQRGHAFADLPDPLRPAWPDMLMARKRAIVATLVEAVVIGPSPAPGNRFDPRRIQEILWRH